MRAGVCVPLHRDVRPCVPALQRLNEIEEERRDEEEARERAKDKRKFKRLGQANLAQAIMATSELNDPSMARKRTKLDLPAPQVSDTELAEIAKAGALEDADYAGDEAAATRALVGVYSAAALPTPMRTPRLPPSQDVIMEEARNLIALNAAPTPLKVRLGRRPRCCLCLGPLSSRCSRDAQGGANPELAVGTGFQGSAPLSRTMATPNPLMEAGAGGATPMRTPFGRGGVPGSVRGGVGATPLRDQLSINAADDVTALTVFGGSVSPAAQRHAARLSSHCCSLLQSLVDRLRQKALQEELRASLKALPEPQYTYEIELPEVRPAHRCCAKPVT